MYSTNVDPWMPLGPPNTSFVALVALGFLLLGAHSLQSAHSTPGAPTTTGAHYAAETPTTRWRIVHIMYHI